MTTVYASSLVPVSNLFPKTDPVPTATDPSTAPINILEAAAEDSAASGQGIVQMLDSGLSSSSGSGVNIFA